MLIIAYPLFEDFRIKCKDNGIGLSGELFIHFGTAAVDNTVLHSIIYRLLSSGYRSNVITESFESHGITSAHKSEAYDKYIAVRYPFHLQLPP